MGKALRGWNYGNLGVKLISRCNISSRVKKKKLRKIAASPRTICWARMIIGVRCSDMSKQEIPDSLPVC